MTELRTPRELLIVRNDELNRYRFVHPREEETLKELGDQYRRITTVGLGDFLQKAKSNKVTLFGEDYYLNALREAWNNRPLEET